MPHRIGLASGLAACLLGVSAFATPVTIGFSNANRSGDTFTSGDLSVTASAISNATTTRDAQALTVVSGIFGVTGLGVAGGATSEVDALEALVLDFTPTPVSLLRAATLELADPRTNAVVTLLADGEEVSTFALTGGLTFNISFDDVTGSILEFRSDARSFLLRSITVEAVTVASPGTLSLLGLAGLAAVWSRRRQRS